MKLSAFTKDARKRYEAERDKLEAERKEIMSIIKSEKTMKPNFENILSLVQKGTSVEFNPEILSFNNVRRIVQEAASHTSCKVTLRNTDAFSPDNWVLLAEEAKGHLAVVFD